MQALAELKNDMQKLKAEENFGPADGGDDVTGYARGCIQAACAGALFRLGRWNFWF